MRPITFIKYALIVICGAGLYSCNDYFSESGSSGSASSGDVKANSWMRSVLAEWYLWNDEIASVPSSELNYSQSYDSFLSKLLGSLSGNSDDGGYTNGQRYLYSYVERTASTRAAAAFDPTFGMGVVFSVTDRYSSRLIGRVTYVYENSPAHKAGIKRGMWFSKINGENITYSNYTKAVTPAAGAQITLSESSVSMSGSSAVITSTGRHYSLTAENIALSPVLADTVFEIGGIKTGYLAYMRFDRGYQGFESTEYEQQLKSVFEKFKARGIDELILDLRYNPGGYTVTCRLLASLIVRNDCLGKTYSQSKYNADKQKTSYGILTETFDTEVAAMNIDMQRVYVLATDRTASAAENIINSLRGADMQVIHIGTRTEGKNVGMTLFEKYGLDGYDYEFWPVTFKIYNAKGESDFGDGFTPDYNIDEWSAEYYSDWKELGQSDEILTAAAISLISGEQTPANEATRSSGHLLQVAGSSDFCKIKGLRETSIANQQ